MEELLYVRQRVKSWFADHELYLMPIIKFILMMTILLLLNWHLGYRYFLMRWVLVILASLVSCLLPWSGMTAVAALYLLGHVSALSWEGTVILVLMMFIAMILHYLFLPGGSFLIVLVCLCFYLKVPYLVPLLAGILGSALTFIPVGIGVIFYYTLACLEKNAAFLLTPGSSIYDCFLQILNGLKDNREMFLAVAAFCLTALAVYAISHLSVDYARTISLASGGLLMLLIYFLGGILLDIPVAYLGVLAGCVVSCLLSGVVIFCSEIVDFSRPERLQYEDDEYIYYVKAIPKLVTTVPEREVKEISSRSGHREAQRREPDRRQT